MRRWREERKRLFVDVVDGLRDLSFEIFGSAEDDMCRLVVEGADLSVKKLEELQRRLCELQDEKSRRLRQGFFNFTSRRPRHLLQILELGYNVMYNDVDMVWLGDPFAYLEGSHDVYFMDDMAEVCSMPVLAFGMTWSETQLRRQDLPVFNMGSEGNMSSQGGRRKGSKLKGFKAAGQRRQIVSEVLTEQLIAGHIEAVTSGPESVCIKGGDGSQEAFPMALEDVGLGQNRGRWKRMARQGGEVQTDRKVEELGKRKDGSIEDDEMEWEGVGKKVRNSETDVTPIRPAGQM
ncbi:hypothetical protein Tsubulata_034201 [Turnera subulata]|uniref:Nucleotide-diphospho-sugar transferase domain-containing protein n=1 Tax=Turnera subulata TaxID=218843 RepID=A0A9Q0F1S0_9ROSI|nr:hypothetical protein Tsubulata_034201 [Turnera subulata]